MRNKLTWSIFLLSLAGPQVNPLVAKRKTLTLISLLRIHT